MWSFGKFAPIDVWSSTLKKFTWLSIHIYGFGIGNCCLHTFPIREQFLNEIFRMYLFQLESQKLLSPTTCLCCCCWSRYPPPLGVWLPLPPDLGGFPEGWECGGWSPVPSPADKISPNSLRKAPKNGTTGHSAIARALLKARSYSADSSAADKKSNTGSVSFSVIDSQNGLSLFDLKQRKLIVTGVFHYISQAWHCVS